MSALRRVTQLTWKSSVKILVHIADCPCHGKEYHTMYDEKPEGKIFFYFFPFKFNKKKN